MEKTQNVFEFKIPGHFLNWITISGLEKSKPPFFPIYHCNRIPPRYLKNLQRSKCNVSFVFSLSDKIAPIFYCSDKIQIRYLKKNLKR